jgi:predicted SprT family Zn-dependent metalloprotease
MGKGDSMIECDAKTDNQREAVKFLEVCAQKAKSKDLLVPDVIYVDFDITSVRTAGTAGQKGVHRNCDKGFEAGYHGQALEHYGLDRFRKTLVHEFCHLLQFANRPGERAHGVYFYSLMGIMGFDNLPNSYHDFDLRTMMGKPKRKQRRWEYKCACDEAHRIATVTHNRVQKKGQLRQCKTCSGILKWTGKELK